MKIARSLNSFKVITCALLLQFPISLSASSVASSARAEAPAEIRHTPKSETPITPTSSQPQVPAEAGAGASTEMNAEELLSLGLKQLEDKFYFSAIESFSDCLDKDPRNLRALDGRQKAYKAAGETDKAEADAKKLLELSGEKSNADSGVENDKKWTEKSAQQAIEKIADAALPASKTPTVEEFIASAKAFSQKNLWDKAVDEMNKCVREYPKSVKAHKLRGELMFVMARYADALYEGNKVVELEPKKAASYTFRAGLLIANKRIQEAFQDCTKGLSLDPKNANLYAQRSCMYLLQQQYNYGIADATKAIALDAKCATAYTNRGACYAALEKYPQAQADLLKATALNPNDKDAWRNLGTTWIYMSKFNQAINCFSRSLSIDPRIASVYHDRGLAYRMLGKYDQANRDMGIARALGFVPR